MAKTPRVRRVYSVKGELLKKSREAALAAVQIFNNPNITFKAETYVVLMIVAWTYLMHAHYRDKRIDYCYFTMKGKKKHYDRTKHGAIKHWELERCLDTDKCDLPKDVVKNLRFLIGLRHEIEHQMTTRIDDLLSARFQACCINYHDAIVSLFGSNYGIAKHLSVSLQFASLKNEQIESLAEHKDLPGNIKRYIEGFDGALSPEEFGSPKFAYRVIFVPKAVNHQGQADRVIEFIKPNSPLAQGLEKTYTVLKDTEKPKHLPNEIVKMMKEEGFNSFGMHQHTQLWQSLNAKEPTKGFGVLVAKTWYWYDNWVCQVRKHCEENATSYKAKA